MIDTKTPETPTMTDHQTPWTKGLLTAARTFSAITGTAGFGLLCGLAFGASTASQTALNDDFFGWIGWLICLVIYEAVGFVAGLAVALLVTLFIGIFKVAKPIARAIEQPAPELSAKPDRADEV